VALDNSDIDSALKYLRDALELLEKDVCST